jgi:hypothetical protein
MGPTPDRFLEYLVSGDHEETVTAPGAIGLYERASMLGCVGAVLLLSEGARLPRQTLARMRNLMHILDRPELYEPRLAEFDALRLATSERAYRLDASGLLDLRTVRGAVDQGYARIAEVRRPSIEFDAQPRPKIARSGGIDAFLYARGTDPSSPSILELRLVTIDDDPPDATALLWSRPEASDAQRAPFDPTGIARLRWPTAPRSTLRIDAGPHTALIDLQVRPL